MKKKHQIIWLLLFFFQVLPHFGQSTSSLLNKADTLKHTNPQEAIKIGTYLLKSIQDANSSALTHLLLSESYLIKGKYAEAIDHAFSPQNTDQVVPETLVQIYLIRAKLLKILFLNDQSKRYLTQAEAILDKLPEPHEQIRLNFAIEDIECSIQQQQYEIALQKIDSLQNYLATVDFNSPKQSLNLHLVKANVFFRKGHYKRAEDVYRRILNILDENKVHNYYLKVLVYNKLGELSIEQKKYINAKLALNRALGYAQKLGNVIFLKDINQNLASTALANNNRKMHEQYNNAYLLLTNTVETIEQEAMNAAYSHMNEFQNKQLEASKQHWQNFRYLIWGAFVGIVLLCVGIYIRSFWRKKHFGEILKYLEISRRIYDLPKEIKVKTKQRLSIPKEREEVILKKLKRFEQTTKFTSKEVSLAYLASYLDTNTKYLSEIIHRNYGDNFSTFINKLRINFIITKLKKDPSYRHYKISFLAEKSGFATHSNFTTVFKSIIGMKPATFIDLLKKDQQHQRND